MSSWDSQPLLPSHHVDVESQKGDKIMLESISWLQDVDRKAFGFGHTEMERVLRDRSSKGDGDDEGDT